jgi:putative hydrolase of the HAD superfamily
MSVRAVFFDLDDTLLETHDSHREAVRLCCERAAERHPEWTPEALQRAFVNAYRALEEKLEAGELDLTSQLEFRKRTWEETLRGCGLTLDLAEELAALYLAERRKRYRLFADVPDGLDYFKTRYRLVLVTNGLSDLQREKIEAVGLGRWISRVAVSGELRSWKPDAGIFRHALELAGVPAREVVMVGDSLERDVAGARALGIRTVWMRRYAHLQPIPDIEPDHVAADLPELAEVLSGAEGCGPASAEKSRRG